MASTIHTPTHSEWDPELVALYELHFTSLVRTASSLVRSTALAEELVHDAFIAFHTGDCTPEAGKEVAYLRSMVLNRGRTMIRRTQRGLELTVPDVLAEPSIDGECLDRLDAGVVRDAVTELPDRQQHVLHLRYAKGLTEAEIAKVLGISQGTVKTHASRARDALRQALAPIV